jgi:hypothetical protein
MNRADAAIVNHSWGINSVKLPPKRTANRFSRLNAIVAPSRIGLDLCLAAKDIHTSWLLSPISARKIMPSVSDEVDRRSKLRNIILLKVRD